METGNNNKIENKTTDQIKEEKKEKLKEYRRNYYREYYKKKPKEKMNLEIQASNNRKRYKEDEEYRQRQIEYSKFYRQIKKKEKEEIYKRLEKLDFLENLIKNNIDFNNSSIAIKV